MTDSELGCLGMDTILTRRDIIRKVSGTLLSRNGKTCRQLSILRDKSWEYLGLNAYDLLKKSFYRLRLMSFCRLPFWEPVLGCQRDHGMSLVLPSGYHRGLRSGFSTVGKGLSISSSAAISKLARLDVSLLLICMGTIFLV